MRASAETVTYSEESVKEWCHLSGDMNPIHLDEEAAADSLFGERVVPGMMVLDTVSGMLASLGSEDETVIFHSVVATRFRDPILFDTEVDIALEEVETESDETTLDFEARVDGTLKVTGTVNVIIV